MTMKEKLYLAGYQAGMKAGLADPEPCLPATAEGQWRDGWLAGNLDAGWERLARALGGGETGQSLRQHAEAHRHENRANLHRKLEALGIPLPATA